MERWLIITEKPSVAGDIAKALGHFEKMDDYYTSTHYLITWAVGHLLELKSPEDIDPKYKSWLLQDLPIIPERFEYKEKAKQKTRLKVIKSLATSNDVTGLINACDAGREGELIFREIEEFCGAQKPHKRMWLQSMTADSIRKEMESLREGSEFDSLGDSARCRSESDWLIGMNGTRAVTRRLRTRSQRGAASWSVGRVQTPTLKLIVDRESKILKHRPETFWTIEGNFDLPDHSYLGQWYDPQFKKPNEDEDERAYVKKDDRIFSSDVLEKVLTDIQANKANASASEKRKESKEIAPQLFDLTSLQREANRRFGMAASRTLQAAQRLYEKHKVLTYPRTDSKYLTQDYNEIVLETLDKYAEHEIFSKHVKKLKKNGLLNKNRVFNDKKVSDHHAIIPTGTLKKSLDGDDQRVFDLVMRRFLAAFMEHAVWDKVERITVIGEQKFRTRMQDLRVPGWREAYGLESEEESKLPVLKNPEGTSVDVIEVEKKEDKTKAPSRYSEAKLLSLMENCGRQVEDEELAEALKEKGIGTPATRAETIENLIRKEYVLRTGKALKATAKGIRLVDILSRIPVNQLTSVGLTGELESSLSEVETGSKTRKEFMDTMVEFTKEIVEKCRSFDYGEVYENEEPLGDCPRCGKGKIRESFWAYKCDNEVSKDDKCGFVVWKEKHNRYIDRTLVEDLLVKRFLGPVEFVTPAGTAYESHLKLLPEGLVMADEAGEPTEPLPGAEPVVIQEVELETTYFSIPAKIIETDIAWFCEFQGTPIVPEEPKEGEEEDKAEAADKKEEDKPKPKKRKRTTKNIKSRMPKVLCGYPITLDTYKSFIETGSTPPITDFTSKKGRPFAASLKLKPNGNFEFRFESRKKLLGEDTKKPKKKATTKKAKVTKKKAAPKKETASTES